MLVDTILQTKGAAVYTLPESATLAEAVGALNAHNIGALVIIGAGDTIAGILSERDYARKMVLHGKASHETAVREVMTATLVSVTPKWTCDECMAVMTERHVRHLPVLDDGRLAGVISIGDVVRAVVQEQQSTITTLESFILSGG